MHRHQPILPLALATAALLSSTSTAQPTNYDESKVPSYRLPDPLRCNDGDQVRSAAQWQSRRRPEIVEMFEQQMFGVVPRDAVEVTFALRERDDKALDGLAVRQQVEIRCRRGEHQVALQLLLYLPADRVAKKAPTSMFLGLNFWGNQTVNADPAILLTGSWVRQRKGRGNKANRATTASRGKSSKRWPVQQILARGYGLATMYYGDIDPDFDDGFENGIHALFASKDRQAERAGNAWGSIATWAWGLSRVLDYLQTDPAIDASKVAVLGHSRLGKTSLWAGAIDRRFAMVVSNDSGCGGAALSRRRFGETGARINRVFPHWFCKNFPAYGGKEHELPLDQHMLVALVAPRPVLICSAEQDRWADPRGEYLAARHADPVYRLLGTDGIETTSMPEPQRLLKSRIGYYLRPGKHDMTPEDWRAYLDFADHHGLGGSR